MEFNVIRGVRHVERSQQSVSFGTRQIFLAIDMLADLVRSASKLTSLDVPAIVAIADLRFELFLVDARKRHGVETAPLVFTLARRVVALIPLLVAALILPVVAIVAILALLILPIAECTARTRAVRHLLRTECRLNFLTLAATNDVQLSIPTWFIVLNQPHQLLRRIKPLVIVADQNVVAVDSRMFRWRTFGDFLDYNAGPILNLALQMAS